MRKDKAKAEVLRRSGKSYKFIRNKLGIPISTLAEWFQKEPWSIEIRDRLASTASLAYPEKLKLLQTMLKKKYDTLHEAYRQEAIDEFAKLKHNQLFVTGIMLYWGEGDKNVKNSMIRLCNSEPDMIRIFNRFLVDIMLVQKEKIIINLLLYPDLPDEPMKRFWSSATGLPSTQFRKSVYIQGRHPTRRLSYGVGNLRVGGRKLKEKLLKWIELWKNEF